MIFRVCEHYSDDDLSNTTDICFICYEFDTTFETRPIRLRQYLQSKQCNCDGLIHQKCLEQWNAKYNKCPICRSLLLTTTNNQSIITVYMINQVKKIGFAVIKSILYCLLMYSYIEFYIAVSTTKHLLNKHSSPVYSNDSRYII